MKRSVLIFIIVSIIGYSCRDHATDSTPVIQLNHLEDIRTKALEDRYNIYFSNYDAVFLENSESAGIWDVTEVIPLDSDIFALINNQLYSYNYLSGKQNRNFTSGNGKFISFGIVNNKLYALDANTSRVCCIDTTGNLLYDIPLSNQHSYDKLILLDSLNALITTREIPLPTTFVVDLEHKIVKPLDIATPKSFTPGQALLDSIQTAFCPVTFYSHTINGQTLIKYLFENTIYQYTPQGKTPAMHIKTKKTFRYKKDIYTQRDKYTVLTGIWQLNNEMWLARWQTATPSYLGGTVSIAVFTIFNNRWEVYNNTLVYNTSLIEWDTPINIYSLNGRHNLFIHPNRKQIFKIIKFDAKKVLPSHLNKSENKQNLILCHFNFAD